jgi:signal peptide peptidase SppA
MAKDNPTWIDQTLELMRPVLPAKLRGDIPIVPVVRLSGVIGAVTPLRPGLTIGGLARTLERAFKVRHARAVALLINSPGGSPVQSHLIFRRIRELAQEHELPVIAFIEDVGASGGYMIACAADEIICDASSMVGSVGVVGGTFGFDKLIEKIGVDRRLYTAGDRKVLLDPFLPENPDDVKRLKAIQKDIHESFIALVKERRSGKLQGPEKTLFSGEFWTGTRARDLGIVDALGELRGTLRERFGDKVLTPLVNAERTSIVRRLIGRQSTGGDLWSRPGLPDEIVSALEARALWARYGL